jgi:RNA polymerase sigma-70 factor (ECF subfamily)
MNMEPYASRTDAELLDAARRDPDAFVALYDRYARAAARWATRAGIPERDVLDVVAELFAQAWRSRRRFRDPGDGSAGAWLYAISRHIAAHYHPRGRVDDAARRRLGLAVNASPDDPADALDAQLRLEDALAALPPAQAAAVRLRVIEELDYAEIGDRLSCTPVTARKHVSRGLRQLRGVLDQEAS